MQIPEHTIWSVHAGRLAFQPNGGEPIFPPATEIWASVFDNAQSICGVPVTISPAKALPEISFSRFSAEPALLLSGNLWQGIRASLVVKAGDVDVPLELPEGNSIPDQLVIDGCWYPIDTESIADSLAGLRSHEVVPDGNINLGQLVWLRGASDLGLDVIDRTEANPAGIVRQAGPSIAKVEGLDAKLYPYQDDGVAFLKIIAQHGLGCILGDEMGLGKTMQVIALVQDALGVIYADIRGGPAELFRSELGKNHRIAHSLYAPDFIVVLLIENKVHLEHLLAAESIEVRIRALVVKGNAVRA